MSAPAQKLAPSPDSTTARVVPVDERLRQLRDESRVEGVSRLRPRQRHARDVAVPRDAERTHGRQPKVSPMAGKRFTAELGALGHDASRPFRPATGSTHGPDRTKVTAVSRHGTIAAACTPLADGGARLDEDAFGPYADFFVDSGIEGILAFGTNGEGVLLSSPSGWARRGGRRPPPRAAPALRLSDADTVALATHAAEAGADAVAVIGPPYFKLDPVEQRSHLLAAARARAASVLRLRVRGHGGYAFDRSMLAASATRRTTSRG